ncbi:MAG: hypothetical protein PHT33_09765 [bacterium]|nr:hypothetical protein [bacterium]
MIKAFVCLLENMLLVIVNEESKVMESCELYVNDRYAIAITSMARIGRKIYLGLTGGPNALAVYDIDREEITVADKIFPWVADRGYCTKIHNAMGILNDGSLLLGEGNHFTWDGLPVTVNYFNRELPERMLARKRAQGFAEVKYTDYCLESLDGWNRTVNDPGGRVLRYRPERGTVETTFLLPQYLYVQSMIVDGNRNRAFGHTIPDNRFFFLDLDSGALRDYGRISDYAHHNMTITPDGVCYGGWLDKAHDNLKLLRFDPDRGKLEHLKKVILPDIGLRIAGNQGIDQWIATHDGRIYMGTCDGRLFRFYYLEEEFEPIASMGYGGRITSMDEDVSGYIWIGAGYPHMRLFGFDPDDESITDYGRINNTYERCYFHASCCFEDRLYLGETDGFSPSLHIINLKSLRGQR